MRVALILAAAMTMAVAVAVSSDAEARGRRGGRSVGLGAGIGVTVPASRANPAVQSASASPETDRTFVRPILPVRAPAEATFPASVRSASAGCSGRRVGQGSGFCELN